MVLALWVFRAFLVFAIALKYIIFPVACVISLVNYPVLTVLVLVFFGKIIVASLSYFLSEVYLKYARFYINMNQIAKVS